MIFYTKFGFFQWVNEINEFGANVLEYLLSHNKSITYMHKCIAWSGWSSAMLTISTGFHFFLLFVCCSHEMIFRRYRYVRFVFRMVLTLECFAGKFNVQVSLWKESRARPIYAKSIFFFGKLKLHMWTRNKGVSVEGFHGMLVFRWRKALINTYQHKKMK